MQINIKKINLPTPTTPHKDYCQRCPSNRAVYPESDPEALEIATYPDGVKQQYVFPCAWRPNKLCRGICEVLGYDEKKHAHILLKTE